MRSICLQALLVVSTFLTACTGGSPAGPGRAGTNGAAGRGGAPAGTVGGAGPALNEGTSGGGADGGVGGGAGAAPDGGAAAAAGSAADGGTAFKKFQCPPGPYPAQVQGASTTICNSGGFTYNYPFNEGPTWVASQSAFFFSNFIQGDAGPNKSAGDIIKVSLAPDGSATCEIWLHDVGCNGLHVSFATGKILGACHGPRAVMEYDPVTKAGRVVANMVHGQMLDSPNDIISTSNGNIYFSNPTFELGGRPQGIGNAVIRIDPMGVTSILQMGTCNGVTLSPDEKTLYVVGAGVWMLNDDGSPGMKTNQPAPAGDGLSMDCAGNVLSIDTMGAFGGPDGKALLAVSGGTAMLIQMAVPGFP